MNEVGFLILFQVCFASYRFSSLNDMYLFYINLEREVQGKSLVFGIYIHVYISIQMKEEELSKSILKLSHV